MMIYSILSFEAIVTIFTSRLYFLQIDEEDVTTYFERGDDMWKSIKYSNVCCVALLVLLFSLQNNLSGTHVQAATIKKQLVVIDPVIDQITQQVLLNVRANGFNPNAKTKRLVTGGLYVNWMMNDPQQTNSLNVSSNDDPPSSHDIQTDLYYLNALAEYKHLHPANSSFDADIAKITPIVHDEFFNYNIPKGWVYFYLLRDGTFLHDPTLTDEACQAATNFYNNWYNRRLGLVYNKSHTPGVYSTEHSLTAGAALIDAGVRWKRIDWIQAGRSTLDTVMSASYQTQAQLFFNNMSVNTDGSEIVSNYQAKSSTQGSAVEALMDAYVLTHDALYLSIASQVLQGLFINNGLWDQRNGGLFFALNMDSHALQNKYKETRAQTHALVGLYRYNQVMQTLGRPQIYLDKQQQLLTLLKSSFYQSTYHGYFYRVTPTFQNYVSRASNGSQQVEDYFTTEAMGLALDALQQTEYTNQ